MAPDLIWPFRTKDQRQYERVDQGWDLEGLGPAEEDVLAVRDGTVTYAHDPGSDGNHFGDPYPVLAFDVAIGAHQSAAYYGHTHPVVSEHTHVHQGDKIAVTSTPGGGGAPGRWLEIGWWGPVGPTGDGQSMRAFLINAPVFGSQLEIVAVMAGSVGFASLSVDGGVYNFDGSAFEGSLAGGAPLAAPIVGGAYTRSGRGYWLVARDGGVFCFGDAAFYGSMGGQRLNKPIVGMAATPDGSGYWLVASDGGIFCFGSAAFHGSTGGLRLNKPIVDMVATPDGGGYWLVATDGGIFAFGDASFFGSTGAIALNQPIVAMAETPSGRGYWLTAADGGIFCFGDATFHGAYPQLTGQQAGRRFVGLAPVGDGYVQVSQWNEPYRWT